MEFASLVQHNQVVWLGRSCVSRGVVDFSGVISRCWVMLHDENSINQSFYQDMQQLQDHQKIFVTNKLHMWSWFGETRVCQPWCKNSFKSATLVFWRITTYSGCKMFFSDKRHFSPICPHRTRELLNQKWAGLPIWHLSYQKLII